MQRVSKHHTHLILKCYVLSLAGGANKVLAKRPGGENFICLIPLTNVYLRWVGKVCMVGRLSAYPLHRAPNSSSTGNVGHTGWHLHFLWKCRAPAFPNITKAGAFFSSGSQGDLHRRKKKKSYSKKRIQTIVSSFILKLSKILREAS